MSTFPGSSNPARIAGALTAGVAALTAAAPAPAQAASAIRWQMLEPGLELARAKAPVTSDSGNSIITILRADLRRFDLKLLSAKNLGVGNMTAKAWARKYRLVAATNAGLFAKDYKTNVGLMVDRGRVNNSRLNKFGALLGFNRTSRRLPRAAIIDRHCKSHRRFRRQYRTVIQGPRLWSCRGQNRWSPRRRAWSMAVFALDRRGRALFFYTRSPYTVYAFANMIRKMPLGLRNGLYLDGGRPSQLYVNARDRELEVTGAFGSTGGAWLNFGARPIPNVLGLIRKQ